MTRAERRRYDREQKKAQAEKVYTLTATQIQVIKDEAVQQALRIVKADEEKNWHERHMEAKQMVDEFFKHNNLVAFSQIVALSCDVLNKHFGFGSKRLGDFLEYALDQFENDTRTYKEIKDEIFEKYQVKIEVYDEDE